MGQKKIDRKGYFARVDLHQLVKLGLSKQEAKIYLWLLSHNSSRATTIGQALKILPTAVYRSGRILQKKGFIKIAGSYPRWFDPLPPEIALQAYVKKQTLNLNQIASHLIQDLTKPTKTTDPTHIQVFTGKEKHFFFSAKEIDKIRKELLIISIGENIPTELLLAVHKAHERGVKIKLIAHKYNEENKEILKNFKKNGMEVKHYPDRDFHLIIYDGKKIILVIDNPEDTERRINIFIQSQGLAKAMRDYFYSVWEKAVEV